MRKNITYHSVQRESTKAEENKPQAQLIVSEQSSVFPKASKTHKEKLKEIKKIFAHINADRND